MKRLTRCNIKREYSKIVPPELQPTDSSNNDFDQEDFDQEDFDQEDFSNEDFSQEDFSFPSLYDDDRPVITRATLRV